MNLPCWSRAVRRRQIPRDLIAQHIAFTFVLVLNWWAESNSGLTATDVDACFRELVLPTLTRFFAQLD